MEIDDDGEVVDVGPGQDPPQQGGGEGGNVGGGDDGGEEADTDSAGTRVWGKLGWKEIGMGVGVAMGFGLAM